MPRLPHRREHDVGGKDARRFVAGRHGGVELREGFDLLLAHRRFCQHLGQGTSELLRCAVFLQEFRDHVLADHEIGKDDVEQVIDGVIADIAQNPIHAEDLERVKTQLIAEAIYAQDNQAVLARWYGGALTTGLSIEDIRSWPDRIRAVTAEQVREAAQKWLEKKRSVTGYLIKDTSTAAKREEKRS